MKLNIPVLAAFGILTALNLYLLSEVRTLKYAIAVTNQNVVDVYESMGFSDSLPGQPKNVSEAIKEVNGRVNMICNRIKCGMPY